MGKDSKTPAPTCALCGYEMAEKVCVKQEGKGGKGCPTLLEKRVLAEANREYDLPNIRKLIPSSDGWMFMRNNCQWPH